MRLGERREGEGRCRLGEEYERGEGKEDLWVRYFFIVFYLLHYCICLYPSTATIAATTTASKPPPTTKEDKPPNGDKSTDKPDKKDDPTRVGLMPGFLNSSTNGAVTQVTHCLACMTLLVLALATILTIT